MKKTASDNITLLIKNSINLQKTVLNLAESTNGLTKRIDSLLNLFGEAARNMDKIKESESRDVELLAKKLREVIGQNKDLAHALVLLEENMRKGRYSSLKQ